ncbi:hypothetical protein Tco_0811011 [Tanacetum coccineum]
MVTHLSPERMIDLGGRQGATGRGILILDLISTLTFSLILSKYLFFLCHFSDKQYAKIARKHSTVALRPITIPSTTPASIVNAPPEIVYDQATSNCGFSYVLIGHPASGITDSFGSRRGCESIKQSSNHGTGGSQFEERIKKLCFTIALSTGADIGKITRK